MSDVKRVLINSTTDTSYNTLFDSEEFEVINSEEWQDCDLLLLVGHSSDITPSQYGAGAIRECGYLDEEQDRVAFTFLEIAMCNDIPVVGICKGAQQLCVHKGGPLIQHVPRVSTHDVTDHLGGIYRDVPADHHQVMVPRHCRECNVVMRNTTTQYPDVISWDYGTVKDVAIQFHPEWASPDHRIRKWFDSYIKREILK